MIQPTGDFDALSEWAWDVIVVGAGPAGSLAAREMAKAGAKILLVDRKPFPRGKVCGACLNGQALSVLNAVGLGTIVPLLGGNTLEGLQLRLAGRATRLALPIGLAVSRSRFDAALVEAALTAGAQFLPETQADVDVVGPGCRWVQLVQHGRKAKAAARVVLVAAGLGHHCLEREPAARTDVDPRSRIGAGCVVEDFPAEFYHEKTIFMGVGRSGYVGLVRVEDGRLNVAGAFDRAFVRRCDGPGRAAVAVLAEAGSPAIATLDEADWQGTVSLTRRPRRLAAERLFLLGDAAGYVEPFTGEGMGWALTSAHAVTPLALQAIDRWDPSLPRAWSALHRRLVGHRQYLCRGLATLLRHPWLARRSIDLVERVPVLARLLIDRVNIPPSSRR
jgi:flavin-dependent dehydrogenase